VRDSATAFAPATVANVGIGFDILGHTVEALGDQVTVVRTAEKGEVRIVRIEGTVTDLPLDAPKNTAGQALISLVREQGVDFGLEVTIRKGIPLGSGLGGSAASAVAAVVAANALLETPLSKLQLLKYAMQGEAVASGSVHVDNIAPSLFGGLVLTVGIDHPRTKQIPVPTGVKCVIVHPHMFLSTREARRILRREIDMSDVIWQCANLAGFISACYSNDLAMMRDAFEDVVIEPQRQALIPGFKAVKQAAMWNGALGCSISGAGPTVFAWAEAPAAEGIRAAMVAAFRANGLESDHWVSAIEGDGARLVDGPA
jgi:homoserine kinase